MATPAIQTLITDAQQVLNLKSLSEIRATLTAVLANANVGTPLNPNLTTQQLWDEFYEIVRQSPTDIESILVNQMMKFVFSPPAPGGAGANHEVIYNNNGVLAGDSKFLWDDALNKLDIDGSATISGDLTVKTNVLKVDTTNNVVGIGTTTPNSYAFNDPAKLVIANDGTAGAGNTFSIVSGSTGFANIAFANGTSGTSRYNGYIKYSHSTNAMEFYTNAGTLGMTLNSSQNLAFPTGKGIDFSATPQPAGMTSELLNDYEEGTWTGTITGSTTNPTTPVTAVGRYTKIGRQVHIQISFSDVNTTGASGTLLITGLPFNNATGFSAQGSIASYSAITFTGSAACAVGSNESYMTILCSVSNAIWNVANHNAGTGRYLNATITYTVA
jgi:hypothetical protein